MKYTFVGCGGVYCYPTVRGNKRRNIIMGWIGCPCYEQFFKLYGYHCDDGNGISCADCPLVELARKMNNG
jgi:hypothetical protein